MRMVPLTLLAVVMPFAALAQDGRPTDRLRNALSAMPVEAIHMSMPFLATFADPAMAGGPSDLLATASMIAPLAALSTASASEWVKLAGFSAEDVGTFLTFGQPPNDVTLWGALSPEMLTTLKAKRETLGFAPLPEMPGIFANGEPMRNDLTRASHIDPWRGRVGRPSVISYDGDRIVQTATSEANLAVRAPSAAAVDLSFVVIALDGLDRALGNSGRAETILEAVLISPAIGLSTPIPDALFTKDPKSFEDTVAALREGSETPQPGIPIYRGGVLAATRVDGEAALIVSLAYSDCTTAGAAAEGFAALWQDKAVRGRTMADIAPGTVTTQAVSGQGGCAGTVTIVADGSDGHPPPFDLALSAMVRREFAPLQIALP